MITPNIFKPRNDWNVRSLRCKKYRNDNFCLLVAHEIRSMVGIDPFCETKYRGLQYVQARQLFLVMMVNHTKRTYESIGKILGKDHATVIHACKTIQNMIDTDKRFKAMYDFIENRVKQLN